MGNAMIVSILEMFQILTPPVTSQIPGTQKGSKVNNFLRKWNKKLKFGICTEDSIPPKIIKDNCDIFAHKLLVVFHTSVGYGLL